MHTLYLASQKHFSILSQYFLLLILTHVFTRGPRTVKVSSSTFWNARVGEGTYGTYGTAAEMLAGVLGGGGTGLRLRVRIKPAGRVVPFSS